MALAVLSVVAMALVVIGRETGLQARRAQPAVFDLTEAVEFIADRLPTDVASRLTHADVRWVLMADAEHLEDATEEDPGRGLEVFDEHTAVARILLRADDEGRGLEDTDVVAVLDGRAEYLRAIGAVGPEASGPEDPTAG